jgi:hypothetical protein
MQSGGQGFEGRRHFSALCLVKWSLLNCYKWSGAGAGDEIETFPKVEQKLSFNTPDFENEGDFFCCKA